MSENKNFEDKLRQKLDNYLPESEPGDWKTFRETYALPVSSQHPWYLPYLWSLLLFAIGVLLIFRIPGSPFAKGHLSEIQVIRDTLYRIDTVFVFPGEPIAHQLSTTQGRQKTLIRSKTQDTPTTLALGKAERNAPDGKKISNANTPPESSTGNTPAISIEEDTRMNAKVIAAEKTPAKHNETAQEIDNRGFDSGILAEDQTLVNQDPAPGIEAQKQKKKIKASISLGPVFQIFFANENNHLKQSPGNFAGIEATIRLNKWQLGAGILNGYLDYEFDDLEEIQSSRMADFPGYLSYSETPEDIKVQTKHLLVPIYAAHILWKTKRFNLWVESGILLNQLNREVFEYDFEDSQPDEVKISSGLEPHWHLSHTYIGTILAYRSNSRLGAALSPRFYLPVKNLGISGAKPLAPALQMKLSWKLF